MAHKFAEIAFTRTVKQVQEKMGSRSGYSSKESGPDRNNLLRDRERGFIEARDSFYIASVSETGWPYIQPPAIANTLPRAMSLPMTASPCS